jgi:hypothetical protein
MIGTGMDAGWPSCLVCRKQGAKEVAPSAFLCDTHHDLWLSSTEFSAEGERPLVARFADFVNMHRQAYEACLEVEHAALAARPAVAWLSRDDCVARFSIDPAVSMDVTVKSKLVRARGGDGEFYLQRVWLEADVAPLAGKA